MTIVEWLTDKLAPLAHESRVVVRDPLRLLDGAESALHTFATAHGFTVLIAATNLVFRDLYERAVADPATGKLLVIDRVPALRRTQTSATQAPPPFYPDLLAATQPVARLELDLRQYLRETTNDPSWPQQVNESRYARLIAAHLDGVLLAHASLRKAEPARFSDTDFEKIVAFAALGVGASAFRRLSSDDYWRIGLEGHAALDEVQTVVPEVARMIKGELRSAPAPFCWLADHDQETVIRAFYLAVILEQHLNTWRLLLANVDPALAQFASIDPATLHEAAPKLVGLDPDQARHDVHAVERSLSKDALRLLLLDQLQLGTPDGCAATLERERYSVLIRSLALLLALDNLLSSQPTHDAQDRIAQALFPETTTAERAFVETRQSESWLALRESYRLAHTVLDLHVKLRAAVRDLGAKAKDQLSFAAFWDLWNGQRLNRLEYYASSLKRHIETSELLPRAATDLPEPFVRAFENIKKQVGKLYDDIYRQLEALNRPFQDLVATQYPVWLSGETDVRLTSQFLHRCVKPHWDPETEQAVVLVFDGMRYDIWDELLRPMLEERLEILAEYQASSLLPSETHISRWALAASALPKEYLSPHRGEDACLKPALKREFGYHGPVNTVAPEGAGTGETVRYRAGKLDYYIFEMCDKELHKITMRDLPGGRLEPSRPLTFIYQMLKDLIDNEVMAIIRSLKPGTKVFVTADHGFGAIRGDWIAFDSSDLNADDDCKYRKCLLRKPINEVAIYPTGAKQHIIGFSPDQLGMPRSIERTNRASGQKERSEYRAIAFPRVGYAFSRRGSRFSPAAYSHGGISIQELLIPMVALRVKQPEQGLLSVGEISGPRELVEDTETDFRLRLHTTTLFGVGAEALRVDVEATCAGGDEPMSLPHQVLFVSGQGVDVVYPVRLGRTQAADDELRQGQMQRTLTIGVTYREGRRTVRKVQIHAFTVQLNSEHVARRVPANLGSILGLMPKNTG